MTNKQANVRAHTVIDPRTMGRPVHLLGGFANQLRDDIADFLRARINRRYKANFQIDAISFVSAPADSQRWLSYEANDGRIHFAIERQLERRDCVDFVQKLYERIVPHHRRHQPA